MCVGYFWKDTQITGNTVYFGLGVTVVQSLSVVQLFATPWTVGCHASLSFTIFWSLLKLMPIESVMPSSHFILYCPLLCLPSIFPSISVFWGNKQQEWSLFFFLYSFTSQKFISIILYSIPAKLVHNEKKAYAFCTPANTALLTDLDIQMNAHCL